MEVIAFVFIPLTFYVIIKIIWLRSKDFTAEQLKKYNEGLKMLEFGLLEEALGYFDRAVKKDPKSMVAYAMRGKCHMALKNYYQAIYNFDKAASYSNDLPEIFLYKGIALYKIEDHKQALKEFNKAVWFYHEKNPATYRWRGYAHNKLGNKEKAIKDFKEAAFMGDSKSIAFLEKEGIVFQTSEKKN